MKTQIRLLLSLVFLLQISCDTKSTPKQDAGITLQSVSKTFKAPIFQNDQRINKIKEIAPKLHQIFENHSLERRIPGIAYGIVVDDSLIIASTTGVVNTDDNRPVTLNSSFRIASMTKSFTAMGILKLRDEGLLSLNDPVTKYIPEMANLKYLTGDSPVITIENLLTMTAGLPEDNPWGDRQLADSDQELLALISEGLSLSKVPSYEYEYSNTGYAMLGYIIKQISGMPYQKYITDTILLPLGMEHTYWEYADVPDEQLVTGYRWEDEKWKKEPILHDGAFGAMGGLITSITDFSKYIGFHLSVWPAKNGQDKGPVKRSTLREMHVPQFPFLNSWNTDWNDEPCASMIGYGYGLGIAMNCKRIRRVSHGGALPGYGSNYAFFPDYGIGLMAFGNLTYTTPIPYDAIEKLLFETLEIQPRKLPASDILIQRQAEVVKLITHWNTDLEKELLADNFYLDKSKELRMKEIQEVLDKAGPIEKVQDISPRNQLRGDFKIQCKNGDVTIFFTLTPEKKSKIQRLDIDFEPKLSK